MLEKIIELTNEYIESMPKKERKKYGQFFTSMETARFMVGLYNFDEKTGKVSVLDAGAGSGILSCAFIERVETIDSIQEIELTCYENDENVLPLLKRNLEYCKEETKKKITVNIIEDNYILSQYFNCFFRQSVAIVRTVGCFSIILYQSSCPESVQSLLSKRFSAVFCIAHTVKCINKLNNIMNTNPVICCFTP